MVPGYCVAVPAVVAELVLALRDPVLHPGPNSLHHFGVLAAELALLVHQAGDVVAHHLGAKGAHVPAWQGGEKCMHLYCIYAKIYEYISTDDTKFRKVNIKRFKHIALISKWPKLPRTFLNIQVSDFSVNNVYL